jgi:hypothetical protein
VRLRPDPGADALVGEELDHHALRLADVDPMHGFDATLNRAQNGLCLGALLRRVRHARLGARSFVVGVRREWIGREPSTCPPRLPPLVR